MLAPRGGWSVEWPTLSPVRPLLRGGRLRPDQRQDLGRKAGKHLARQLDLGLLRRGLRDEGVERETGELDQGLARHPQLFERLRLAVEEGIDALGNAVGKGP